ncbi:MAG: hypothetical protein HDS32_02300 [Bacteroides sp.]|nr:hypothetical protein [Bacteroides sp.]
MKTRRILSLIIAAIFCVGSIYAQNSAPRPGAGGGFNPNSGNSAPRPGAGGAFTPNVSQGPGPGAGFGPNVPMWGTGNSMMNGGPWGPGAFSGPYNNNGPVFNQGNSQVIGVGYDAQGVWETVPLDIHWDWNGFFYEITVVNAWNPWTEMWDENVDMSAFQTTYKLRGVTYSYYVNLSTGTYYFNP